MNALQIGKPAALGFIVGMAHAMTDMRFLSTDCAFLSHKILPEKQ
jgi:hypothetical protein